MNEGVLRNATAWLCQTCNFVLAYVENNSVIRIKRKDLYVEAEGGKVTVTCCRCGKRNTVTDSKYIDLREESTKKEVKADGV